MKIIKTIKELKRYISDINRLGFVPTMGGLHKGHLALIKKSKEKCKKTLVSIYVNPTQFNNKKDFKNYPRNINNDLNKLNKLNVNYVFIPKTSEIYKKKRKQKIVINNKKNILCGKYRKGHFEGVVDIIDRFLNIIKPKYMFLGEKDFQQYFLIQNHVKKKFKVKIILCKTIRDKNFLALSSRNFLLSKKSIITAGKISKKLKLFKNKIKKNNKHIKKINEYKKYLTKKFNINIDYLEARNIKDLSKFKINNDFKLFVAYYIDKIRLIDNY
tara:strand:- start:375 stop:1187 length:813 start_codon:yes stop_codon:yes gene_type:complete